ncbi:MAG: MFS transporter [Paracoccaceae bacterium]
MFSTPANPRQITIIIGMGQLIVWGMTYYLPAVIAAPVRAETGWSEGLVFGAFSLAVLVSGLVAPTVGHWMVATSARRVLSVGLILNAAGLGLLGVAHSPAIWVLGWLVLGLGMAMGLYTAAFSALGLMFVSGTRRAITNVTLFGGFASTAMWPLGAWLLPQIGWRMLCFTYALALLCLVLPFYRRGLPRPHSGGAPGSVRPAGAPPVSLRQTMIFAALAANLMISGFISATLSVHLLAILGALGASAAVAVGLGAMIGPAQVGARVLERIGGERLHPLYTLLISNVALALGIGLLMVGQPFLALAVIAYGAGNGLTTIARGTVPLALFGQAHYARWIGRLAVPALAVQASAPLLSALIITRFGMGGLLTGLGIAALCGPPICLFLLRVQPAPDR